MNTESKKDYIIHNTNNLERSEREMVGSIFSSKYAGILQAKRKGTAIDLDLVDDSTINQVYDYVKNAMDKKLNQFKN